MQHDLGVARYGRRATKLKKWKIIYKVFMKSGLSIIRYFDPQLQNGACIRDAVPAVSLTQSSRLRGICSTAIPSPIMPTPFPLPTLFFRYREHTCFSLSQHLSSHVEPLHLDS